jgi:methylmalonyl-CoA mutase
MGDLRAQKTAPHHDGSTVGRMSEESGSEDLVLAGEFPPVTRDQWRASVDRVIGKGLDDLSPEALDRRFVKTLVTPTYDGLRLQPLYTGSDVASLVDAGFPGAAPYVRGRTALGPGLGGWDVCQRVDVDSEGVPFGSAAAELEGGATSLWLGLRQTPDVDVPVLAKVLEGIQLNLIAVRLDAGSRVAQAAQSLVELWARSGIDQAHERAVLGFDPLGEAAASGQFGDQLLEAVAEMAVWADRCSREHPGVRAVVVDGSVYHGAGASDAQELGCVLATGVSYLRDLSRTGLDMDAAFGQLEARLVATADQFSTIAKFRAARRLWGRVGEVLGVSPANGVPPCHAVTSPAMLSAYDPWVNLLRTTVACFSAGVGGADAVTVSPYDVISTGPGSSDLGRRLARNIHSLLVEESHLASVVDLAGGSWYVESLTDGLARKAWEWFQKIEGAGGMLVALSEGMVREQLAATWQARADRLATGADPLTGVSEFPNVDEVPPDTAALTASLASDLTGPGLPRRRWPAAFEAQRLRADRCLEQTGSRPSVLVATLGPPAASSARATFARNLFGVAGIESIDPDGPGPDAWSRALEASGARLACICSDDGTYQEQATEAARQLKAAGVGRLYLAGRPGDCRAEWEEAGVDEFVHQGVDRLDVLERALDVAGAP